MKDEPNMGEVVPLRSEPLTPEDQFAHLRKQIAALNNAVVQNDANAAQIRRKAQEMIDDLTDECQREIEKVENERNELLADKDREREALRQRMHDLQMSAADLTRHSFMLKVEVPR